jgi:transposase
MRAAAEAAGVSMRCARKWVSRYRIDGEQGLLDRSSAPGRVADRAWPDRVAVIVSLRQLRMRAAESAETLAMPLSTVSVVLKRHGMGRLGRIGLEQPVRYERSRPGELVHIDIKKQRFIRTMLNGWAYAALYRSSHERTTALDGWLWHYNHRRRHSALGRQPPVNRTNLVGSYN